MCYKHRYFGRKLQFSVFNLSKHRNFHAEVISKIREEGSFLVYQAKIIV
jgi:hypothetical protein